MSSLKPELVRNSRFNEWAGGVPTQWEIVSQTNTTFNELQRTDPPSHPRRRTFESAFKSSEYIYPGSESSLRAVLAGAAVAGNMALRYPAASGLGIPVDPHQRYAVTVACRCNVADNDLRVRIIGLDAANADAFYLRPTGGAVYHHMHGTGFEWTTTATDIEVRMEDRWVLYGFEALIPGGDFVSLAVQVANADGGAQTIDLGEVSVTEQTYGLVGAGD